MENSLKVLQNMTVDSFKEANNTNTLRVVKNPKNDKMFVTDEAGNSLAAVSRNYDSNAGVKVFKLIQFEEESTPIWVLSSSTSENIVEEF